MDTAVFYKVMVPLLMVLHTALIMITTVTTSYAFFSELITRTDSLTGQPLFNIIKIGMICDDCQDGPDPDSCPHRETSAAPWKADIERNRRVADLYGDQVVTLRQELKGIVTDDTNKAFESKWITALEHRAPWRNDSYRPNFVFVGCDPKGSGTNAYASEMAIVSIFFHEGTLVIAGVDSHKVVGGELVKRFVQSHVEALRRVRGLEDSHIIFIPEANMGDTAGSLWTYIQNKRNVYAMREMPAGNVGVLTTEDSKDISVRMLCEFLSKDAVRLHHQLVVSNPFLPDRAVAIKSTLKKLIEQLHRFRSVFTISDNPRVRPHLVYSGAITSSGTVSRTQRDDICMALLIAVLWSGYFDKNMCRSLHPEQFLDANVLAQVGTGISVQA